MSANTSLHRIALGRTCDGKCWIPKEWGRHVCNRKRKWLIFPAGDGTLDTTQFSNLCANVCDDHISKAIQKSARSRAVKVRGA